MHCEACNLGTVRPSYDIQHHSKHTPGDICGACHGGIRPSRHSDSSDDILPATCRNEDYLLQQRLIATEASPACAAHRSGTFSQQPCWPLSTHAQSLRTKSRTLLQPRQRLLCPRAPRAQRPGPAPEVSLYADKKRALPRPPKRR